MAEIVSRRRFLALCSVAVPGLWIPGRGLIELPGKFVIKFAGSCWFCGKDGQQVRGLAGVVGKQVRICDECLSLCFDIIAEEFDRESLAANRPVSSPPATQVRDELEQAVRDTLARYDADDDAIDRTMEDLRRHLDGPSPPAEDRIKLSCSFCDRHQKDVRKLVAGPTVYICDTCIGDAGALFPQVLRESQSRP